MAALKYCRKSYLGFCNAEDEDVNRCPYLRAIEEIVKLSIENKKTEEINKNEREKSNR